MEVLEKQFSFTKTAGQRLFKFSKEKGYYYLKYYEDCITDNS